MKLPALHFPDTPLLVRYAVAKAMSEAGAFGADWRVALEAIARFESDCESAPAITATCPNCRGMMQQSVTQYDAAYAGGFIAAPNFASRKQAVKVAIHYIDGDLAGFGGYGGIENLLARTDRGPGEVLRYWIAHPAAGFAEMRPLYRGY